MRLAVVYASTGRPEILSEGLSFIRAQTRPADRVIISAVDESDLPALEARRDVEVIFGAKGLARQRNVALTHIAQTADIILFFDDDFAPAPNYLAALETLFSNDPSLAGATGRVLADGIGGPGLTFAQARETLAEHEAHVAPAAAPRAVRSLYGCNMAINQALAHTLRFDERLPLYGWQEDVDFTVQLARRGRLVNAATLVGVHLGVKRARSRGLSMGYAQIANPIYLRRKRTMHLTHAYSLIARNVAANLIRSISPEPWCDRRGRLMGNVRALRDFIQGDLDPMNILELR